MKISVFYSHLNQLLEEENCPLEELFAFFASQGLDSIEMPFVCIERIGRERLRDALERAGLCLSGIFILCDFAKDPDLAPIRAMVADARYFGVENVMIVPGFFQDPDRREEEARQMVEALRTACVIGKDSGVGITVEDFGAANTITSTLPEMLQLLEQVDDLKATLDTGNFLYSDTGVLEAFPLLQKRIVHVHMKDQNLRCPAEYTGPVDHSTSGVAIYPSAIGYGDLPLREVLQKLHDIGYDGHLAIEIFRMPHMKQAITDSIRWIRDTLDMIEKG